MRIVISADERYPDYQARELDDKGVNKIDEQVIDLHKTVFLRWLRIQTEYDIMQDEMQKKLDELE